MADPGNVIAFILIWCGVSLEWIEVIRAERKDKIKAVLFQVLL